VLAVEAEGARVQRDTMSGLHAEVDYLTQAARRSDAQLQQREKELAEAAQALRDEAARARLLEEELMRCQVRWPCHVVCMRGVGRMTASRECAVQGTAQPPG
jgi:hypothetical protein